MKTRHWLWAGLFAVVVTVFILDQGLKNSPNSGFAPASAHWQASTADFPRFWGELEASGPYARVLDHVARPLHPIEVAVYERTGVRPTAMRWAVWMGRQWTASGDAETWGICVRPGILVHAAHAMRRLRGIHPDTSGVYAYADVYYGWRQGFLIVSAAPGFVAESLNPAASTAIDSPPSGAMRVRWHPSGARPLEAFVRARGDLEIAAWVDGEFPPGDRPAQSPAEAWPNAMLFSMSAAQIDHAGELRRAALEWSGATPVGALAGEMLDEIWRHWDLPALDGDAAQPSMAMALGLDLAYRGAVLPEPSVAARFYAPGGTEESHPLTPWLDALDPIPFEWDGVNGACATLLGDAFALCIAGEGTPWLAASNEPLIARLAAHAPAPRWEDADVVLTLDWRRAATLMRQGLLVAARNEWIAGHDMATLEADWGDWLDALAEMGAIRLEGHAMTGGMRFHGLLTTTATGTGP